MESRFFEPSDNSNQKSFPSPPSDTVILVTPDYLKYPIFGTNCRFPLRFEKFGFNCNFEMIIRSLDVRIESVFVLPRFWMRLYDTSFGALCNSFRAIRSPPPQVQRCPYACGFIMISVTSAAATISRAIYIHTRKIHCGLHKPRITQAVAYIRREVTVLTVYLKKE